MRDELSYLLKEKFDLLKKNNPRFSLRALALKLAISPAHLSEFFNHRRTLSKKSLEKLMTGLHLSEAERGQALCLLEEQKKRKQMSSHDVGFDLCLVLAVFETISVGHRAFEIADKTGLCVQRTQEILDLLTQMEILECRSDVFVKNLEFTHDQQKSYLNGIERMKQIFFAEFLRSQEMLKEK